MAFGKICLLSSERVLQNYRLFMTRSDGSIFKMQTLISKPVSSSTMRATYVSHISLRFISIFLKLLLFIRSTFLWWIFGGLCVLPTRCAKSCEVDTAAGFISCYCCLIRACRRCKNLQKYEYVYAAAASASIFMKADLVVQSFKKI